MKNKTPDFRLIATFVEAARRGSLTAAAKALQISPAAASKNIAALENLLGARLFARTTRALKLTDEGQRYLERSGPALDALADASEAIGAGQEAIAGPLRITTTTAFGRMDLLPLVASFSELYPQVSFDINFSDGFTDLVAEGYDLAIRGGILPDSSYIARLLVPIEMMMTASPDYLSKYGAPKSIDDLDRHKCVGLLSSPAQRVFAWEFEREGQVYKIDIEPSMIVSEPEAAVITARLGMGIAMLGSTLVRRDIEAGSLVHLLPETVARTRGVYAVHPNRHHVPARLRAFIDHLAANFMR